MKDIRFENFDVEVEEGKVIYNTTNAKNDENSKLERGED